MNLQMHNHLQASNFTAIFVAIRKLSQKGIYNMKDFVFITLKLLILEILEKSLGRSERDKCPPMHPRSYGTVTCWTKVNKISKVGYIFQV